MIRDYRVISPGVIVDVLLDGVIGGVVGSVIIGAAQVWSFRQGKKSARADQSISAAADLLSTIYAAKDTLNVLPYTEAAIGSPLSYKERGDRAEPMLEELRRVVFVKLPLLTDRELARRLRLFQTICTFTASGSVDASEIHEAVTEASTYADHLRACFAAHINEEPLPAEPKLAIMTRAVGRQVIINSVNKAGQVVTTGDPGT
jgi:hypothetical protein